jgi:ATP-dependent RNA helicase DeaD
LGFDYSRAYNPQPARTEPRRPENEQERVKEPAKGHVEARAPRAEPPAPAREAAPKPASEGEPRESRGRRGRGGRSGGGERERRGERRGGPREGRDRDRDSRPRGRGERGERHGGGGGHHRDRDERYGRRADRFDEPETQEPEREDYSGVAAVDVPEPAEGWGGEFAKFPVSKKILRALHEIGFKTPTEIQSRVIPIALDGRDVVGQARTGTGKTAAFAVPILDRHCRDPRTGSRSPRALILAPTRELALQIEEQFQKIGRHTGCRSVPVYGGASMEPQLRALKSGADVIIGTPGRVMDHVRRGTLKLDAIEVFVLDEADRMFDLGFRDDIYWVARRLPEGKRQTMLLSATMPEEVLKLAKQVTAAPELVYTTQGEETLTVDTVDQSYVAVDQERKLELLAALVVRENPEKGIVFTRTKRGADRVAARLRERGVDAEEIHGDLRQKRRESILKAFRDNRLHLLIATDVAARGLDIDNVTHIFNHDIPENPEDYVHRIGRTARMGKKGRAITFVTRADGPFLTDIEKLINKHIPREELEGFRWESTAEERGDDQGAHPLSEKLSPGLLSILKSASRRGGSGPRPGGGRGGPPRGGSRGGPRRGGDKRGRPRR